MQFPTIFKSNQIKKMRTLTIEKQVYNYADLLLPENIELKQKVIKKEYYINVDHDDWYSEECYQTAAKLLGFLDFELYFSGFHSQGDGACFKTKRYQYEQRSVQKIKEEFPEWVDLHNIAERLQKVQKLNFYQLLISTKHRGHYYHEYCMDVYIERNDYKNIVNEEEIVDIFRSFARLIYKSLNEEYDYLTSEEAILQTIQANDYEFDEEGNII